MAYLCNLDRSMIGLLLAGATAANLAVVRSLHSLGTRYCTTNGAKPRRRSHLRFGEGWQ